MIEWMSRRELLEEFMDEYDIIGLMEAEESQMVEFIRKHMEAPISRRQERNKCYVTERGTMETGGDVFLYPVSGIPQR